MNKSKNLKVVYNNQRGSTILLITVLILSSVLVVTLTSSEIIRIGLMMSKNQLDAAKAFYAAEAGAEQVLWEVRSGAFNFSSCATNGCLGFTAGQIASCDNSCVGAGVITLSNDSSYKIKYDPLTAVPDTIITCYGKYKDVNRTVELIF